jgi:hypothetical protein
MKPRFLLIALVFVVAQFVRAQSTQEPVRPSWRSNSSHVTPPGAPLTIMLNDKGKKAAGTAVWDRHHEVADRMDRGEQGLVLDLLFTGDAA